ncbi:alpha/beta hydrolase [Geodermatophilus sp. SYSU D00815]
MSEPDRVPVVFVHGLWLHSSSWAPWVELFTARGFAAHAPGWPGDAPTAAGTRARPEAVADVGIAAVTDSYSAFIAELPAPPVVVGHSFGGLVAQRLHAMGFARACIALSPTQFKGVLGLPPVQLRNALPVLSRPWLLRRTWMHTPESFHRAFASAVPRAESDALYEAHVIPSPARPLFQAGLANLAPRSEAAVDTRAERGPLLMVAAGEDRTVPESTVRAAHRIQAKRNAGVTEFTSFPGRGHSYGADSGWRDVADTALDFLSRHGVAAAPTSAAG